ncbi:zinc-alpha-2-glycoprotein-like [Thunnus maccoyii]|uniref:zinc-alpha-2-glycoprotein-like n=1 Tax=Thunnus maccoyii TaxID=8240 RepID=UPI001C4BDC24|nr:zinc-alpha-2-glycoprotein-like [Thunnus maccoyii]
MKRSSNGSHSLVFLSTGRVRTGDTHSSEQLTVFDGAPISHCDSLTKKDEFKQTLQSKHLPPRCDNAIADILDTLYDIPKYINSSVYIVQRRRGCIQSTNETVSAFDTWAVNGIDFISFDPESQRWTSQSPSAKTVEHLWNNDRARNAVFRGFIRSQCPQMIQRIKLRPIKQNTELRVFAKSTANTDQVQLRCHVTSTDKSVSSVHLIGNGAPRASWITVTGPLPSGDGSVIIRLTAGISLSRNTNTYGCTVQTGGDSITVFWDGSTLDGRHLVYDLHKWDILIAITGFCSVVTVITLISCGMIFLLKCVKKKSRPPPTVDPQLTVQYTRIMGGVTSSDLQVVIAANIQGTERNREYQDRWEVWITSRDQNYYDPEYFANRV